jgi:ABC-2 type transport system permease protein
VNGFNFKRFITIVKKEIIQVKRDPIALRIPLLLPIVMMFLFGYAVTTEVDEISTAVFDNSKTMESRDYIETFVASNYFYIKTYVNSEKELSKLLDGGNVNAGIIIPEDFAKNMKKNRPLDTQLIIDGTDPTTARTALSSGVLISNMYNRLNSQNSVIGVDEIESMNINSKVWYNPNLESEKFTIPALVGLILQNITIMLTAFALVREKERNTIEQLIVTPVKRTELILGKLVPYVFIGYVGFLFALGICVFWFKVSVTGSILLLLTLGFLFVFCSLSIGMLISTFAKNQLQAMMAMIVVILPSIILSGFIFPREAMPDIIRFIGYLIPLTYFLEISRGIILKGVDISFLWNEVITLLIFTFMILTISIIRVRKSLD